MKKKSGADLGFTLVETLLAVIILSSALLLLTTSWNSSFIRVQKTQRAFEVAQLLERKMTELELEYRGKPIDSIPEEAEDKFGEDENLKSYSWKMESQKLEIPDFSSTLASQDGGVDAFTASLVKQMTETLSKAIREMTVTIIFTPPKGKPLTYSATMYFVDYDKEMTLGVPQ